MAEQIRLADRLEGLDKEIRAWSRVTRKDLLFRLAALNLEERVRLSDEVSLKKSLRAKIKKKSGEIERVAFSFARHGIFLEHGVGKGRPVGSAQANRYKKPWLSIVLPDAIENLADILEEEYADIIAAELKFVIPGIIDTKVS